MLLPEDDELGALLLDQVEERRPRPPCTGCPRSTGKSTTAGSVGARVAGDVVAQRAHRLRAQVAALADVVVHHLADAARLGLAVGAVEVVDERAEHGHVGHLAADDAGLDLGAAEVRAELAYEQALDLVDEAGALVVEDLGVVEGLRLLVLGVAERRVGDREPGGPAARPSSREGIRLMHSSWRQTWFAIVSREQPQRLLAGLAAAASSSAAAS